MIFFEAIHKFINVETIEQPNLLLIVGMLGIVANTVGIFLLGGHNHGDNVRGIFLHVLGDFVGSIAVVMSACIAKYTNWVYKDYVDPAISLLVLAILLFGSSRLFMKTSKTFLELTPSNVNIDKLINDLMKIKGVIAVHELHVWQFSNQNYISTCHLVVDSKEKYKQIYADSTNIFMQHQVFSSTIQVEFVEDFPKGVDHAASCFNKSAVADCQKELTGLPVHQCFPKCSSNNLAQKRINHMDGEEDLKSTQTHNNQQHQAKNLNSVVFEEFDPLLDLTKPHVNHFS